jgi:peptide/nickel transport system permease protein
MFTPGKPFNPIDWFRHLIMPAFVLGLAGVGPILRYVRTSILETLGKDYLVTARSKGLPVTATVVRHAFPNALLPFITYVGIQVGTLMAGAFITETIFTWPGMGQLALNSILSKDYPVIQAFAVVTGAMVLIGNLLADLAYGVADPRIRLE